MTDDLPDFDQNDGSKKVQIKAILLGESGVGKTCIIERFYDNTYVNCHNTTDSFSFKEKLLTFPEFKDVVVKLQIWDTIGQEAYRSLAPIFFKDARIGILVYDMTVKQSFEEMKNYWGPKLTSLGMEDIVLGVAANKSDVFEMTQVNANQGRAYAEEIGAVFEETSAATNSGIDKLFNELAFKYLEKNGFEKVIVNENKDAIRIDSISRDKKKCC